MDSDKTKTIVQRIRKRLRSNDEDTRESKRMKDLLETDMEAFLDILNNIDPEDCVTKPEMIQNNANPTMNNPRDVLKKNTSNDDLLLKFSVMFEKLETNLGSKIDNLKDELLVKDKKIIELER